jgi:hypothetical protein
MSSQTIQIDVPSIQLALPMPAGLGANVRVEAARDFAPVETRPGHAELEGFPVRYRRKAVPRFAPATSPRFTPASVEMRQRA